MTYADWRERFLEAVDTRLYPAEWLDRRVASGRARFWGNDKAAILAEIRTYPSGVKEAHGLVSAKTEDAGFEDIKALVLHAEAWGRERGCLLGAIESHPAWAKIMRDAGYEVSQVLIQKVL